MSTASLIIIIASLGLSFFLSGMETGVFALSRLRIRHLMRSGRESARLLEGYLDRPEDFLWTICVGNTVSNFTAVALTTWWLLQRLGSQPALFAAAWCALAFGLYVWCELLPKMIFREFPNRLCLWMVRPYRWIHLLLSPLAAIVARAASVTLRWTGGRKFTGNLFGNREELRLVMQESGESVTDENRAVIGRVLDLQSRTVAEVMVPLEKARTVDSTATISEAVSTCQESGCSRIPVLLRRGTQRRVLGIFSLRSFLYRPAMDPSQPVTACQLNTPQFRSDLKLGLALQRLQRSGHRMVVVVDPSGVEVGILTLQDILSVIFGEVSL